MLQPLRFRSLRRTDERGAILLTVAALISFLMLMASSSSMSSANHIDVAEDEIGALHVELLVESALAHTRLRLADDPDWEGTGDENVVIAPDRSFSVQVVGDAVGGGTEIILAGITAESTSMMRAVIDVVEGGSSSLPLLRGALVTMGGSLDMNSVKIYDGDVYIVDVASGVHDWDADAQQYVEADIDDPDIDANSVEITDDLYAFENTFSGVSADDRLELDAPVQTPRWNLDAFLVPNANSTIRTSTTLNNLTTDRTVVVNLQPGQHLNIQNCKLRGGLVIYSEGSLDPRGAPRNTFSYNSSTFGHSSPRGMIGKLGILAPGAKLKEGNSMDAGYGLFYMHSIERMNSAKILKGALWVLNDALHPLGDPGLNSVEITVDATIWNGAFDNYFAASPATTSLLALHEYFPD